MLSPREKRQARTRQEILNAALAIIAEKGADNFTLRGLARRVQYSPAGLYEYFHSKDDIIDAVCSEADLRLRHYLQEVPEELAPDQRLVALGKAYVRFALENEEHFTLMFSRVPQDEPVSHEHVAQDETYSILLDAVHAALAGGFVQASAELSDHEVAYGLWSLAHGLAVMQLTNLRHVQFDFQGADEKTLQAFVRGLGCRLTAQS